MANRWLNQFFYGLHKMPVLLDCNFVVDSANGNGLGIRSLKGPGIAAVYMNTSSTPAPGNPNPAAGVIILQLQDTYFRYFGGFSGQVQPVSGTPLTATTANTAYVIVSLGTATVAQWQAVGLPVGLIPTVGQAFVATASATIGGSAAVEVSAAAGSGIDHIEVLGDPNTTIGTPQALPYVILQCFAGGAKTAPADGSVISLATYLSNSSVTVQKENNNVIRQKKAAGIILGKMHKDGSSEHEEKPHFAEGGAVENVDHDFEGLHAAAQEMMDAIHSKSPMDVHKALSSYLELHKQLQPGEKAEDGYDANEKGSESAQMKYNK